MITRGLDALDRNEKRDRTVPVNVAKKSWNDVQKNMKSLKSLFKANFYMADNSAHLEPEQAQKKFNGLVKKGIDQFVKKPIKNKIAKDWVKKQRILKKQGIKENIMSEDILNENPASGTMDGVSDLDVATELGILCPFAEIDTNRKEYQKKEDKLHQWPLTQLASSSTSFDISSQARELARLPCRPGRRS